MNPFKSKRIYNAAVVSDLLIPEDEHQPFLKNTILAATLGNYPVSETFRDGMLKGFSAQVDRYYRYGRDVYTYGLPEGVTTDGVVELDAVKKVIEDIRGQAIEIEDVELLYPDPENLAWEWLDVQYGFNPDNWKILNPIEPGYTDQEYLSAEFDDETDELIIYYTMSGEEKSLVVTWPGLNRNHKYLTASYRNVSGDTRIRKWNYRILSGVHPTVKYDTLEVDSEFLPLCAVRYDYENIVSGHPQYLTTRRMLQQLAINIDDVVEALMTDEDGNVPSEMQDAFVLFQAQIDSEDKYVNMYLFDFFKDQLQYQPANKQSTFWQFITGEIPFPPPATEVSIKNEISQNTVFFNYIERSVVSGSIGEVDTVETEITINDSFQYQRHSFLNESIDMSVFEVRKQINSNQYEVLKVHGLFTVHDVHRKAQVVRYLSEIVDPENDGDTGMYIPVNQRIVRNISNPFTRSQIYQSTLALTVYALDVQKVRWYQTSTFRYLLQIAAIVITIVTGGTGAAAVTVVGAIQVIANIFVQLVINMVLAYSIKVVIEVLGIEVGLILAIAGTALAVYGGALGPESMPWAQDLLRLSTITFDANNLVMADSLRDMARELEALMEEYQTQYDEIEEINDMLNNSGVNLLDSVTHIPIINPWEDSNDFFNRTINIQNPGIAVINTVDNFIHSKLDLEQELI